jgi:uncharacterized membrane protein YgdD (TMEM256/DUF423 family)
MSIATNETDKQVGTILESIQAVTPEVAEEAVMYYRVMNSAWLVILVVVILVAGFLLRLCMKKAPCFDYATEGIWPLGTLLSGLVVFFGSLACIALANDLVHSFIAPQHYAAECIMELGGKAFGS